MAATKAPAAPGNETRAATIPQEGEGGTASLEGSCAPLSPAGVQPTDGEGSVWRLEARLALLVERVAAGVEARRASDPNPGDPFRGLYIDDALVDRMLAAPATAENSSPEGPEPDSSHFAARLRALAGNFALSELELDILVAALAPDLNPRFEKLYGYLNDDVTRRRASVGLAMELCGASFADGSARQCFASGSKLLSSGLLVVEDGERPLLSRALRVPDRVVTHLLGRDEPDALVRPLLRPAASWPGAPSPLIGRALESHVDLIYAQSAPGGCALSWLVASLRAAGRPAFVVDLELTDTLSDHELLAAASSREARLCGGALVVTGIDHLTDRPAVLRSWTERPGTVVLIGSKVWDPRWSSRPPLLVESPLLTETQRVGLWQAALATEPPLNGVGEPPAEPLSHGLSAYRLSPEQIWLAASSARRRAAAAERPVTAEDLRWGARAQNAAGLEHLAQRITPRVGFDDLVVPAPVERQLRALAGRVRHRSLVLDDWKMASAATRGRGVTVLFAGDSGTGKTMSAEVVAESLGLELYVIDLSSVVDKYVGETEKNLDRIFVEAEGVNGVLLFDEADAVFGKRSEVKDAHDRYANVEVAYLLQRMERFDGVAILTTNLRSNVDEAFLRRIDVVVEFSLPSPEQRERLWRKLIRREVPRGDDIDVPYLARSFELSGGNIRNVVLAAAFEAADAGMPMTMANMVRATSAEYRKLGRLCVESEFGVWFAVLQE